MKNLNQCVDLPIGTPLSREQIEEIRQPGTWTRYSFAKRQRLGRDFYSTGEYLKLGLCVHRYRSEGSKQIYIKLKTTPTHP